MGTYALRYAEALARLSAEGSQDAEYALRLLMNKARENQNCLSKDLWRAIDCESVVPLELSRSARWKMDGFGLVALQILLCLWKSRRNFNHDSIYSLGDDHDSYGIHAYYIGPFHSDSAAAWWELALNTFTDFYRHPEQLPGLASCVKGPSANRSPSARRNYIIRKVRERFVNFAPPPPGSRY